MIYRGRRKYGGILNSNKAAAGRDNSSKWRVERRRVSLFGGGCGAVVIAQHSC